jgi:hypothetical protein
MGIQIWKSIHRQLHKSDWLNKYSTFSLNEKGFSSISAIYELHLKAGLGFPIIDLKNTEVFSLILEGSLSHQDFLNNLTILHEGDIQLVSAGAGIGQSELNASDSKEATLLQVFINPEKLNTEPRYQTRACKESIQKNCLNLIVSKDGRDHSLQINQECNFFIADMDQEYKIMHKFATNQSGWLQIIKGSVDVNGLNLELGDSIAITNTSSVEIFARAGSKFLLIEFINK